MNNSTTIPISNSTSSKPQPTAMLRVTVEILEDLVFSLDIPGDSEHTSGWLLGHIRFLLAKQFYAKRCSTEFVSSIVGLQTKNNDLHLNYLLSLPDMVLTFLPDKITLVPYYCTLNVSTADCIEPKITLNDFEILSKIGEGGFGMIYLVRMKTNGQFYALKQLDKTRINEEKLLRERNIMVSIESDFALKLHFAFQTDQFCYFVLDFAPLGDLLRLKSRLAKLTEDEAKFYVVGILLALEELHSKSIMYRDLKLENVLIDLDGYVKLCDFGLAKKIEGDKKHNKSICGTPHFMSPEMISGKGYNCTSDYHAVGILVYELVTGRMPFFDKQIEQLKLKIAKSLPPFPPGVSQEFKDFVNGLLEKDPKQRLGAEGGVQEILCHRWLKTIDLGRYKLKELSAPCIAEPATKNLKVLSDWFNIEEKTEMARRPQRFEGKTIRFFSYQIEDPNNPVLESKKLRSLDQTSTKYSLASSPVTDKRTNYSNVEFDETDETFSSMATKLSKYQFKIPDNVKF